MQADEQDILIWDSEIRRLGAGRGEEQRPRNRQPKPAGTPATPVHMMATSPPGTRQQG